MPPCAGSSRRRTCRGRRRSRDRPRQSGVARTRRRDGHSLRIVGRGIGAARHARGARSWRPPPTSSRLKGSRPPGSRTSRRRPRWPCRPSTRPSPTSETSSPAHSTERFEVTRPTLRSRLSPGGPSSSTSPIPSVSWSWWPETRAGCTSERHRCSTCCSQRRSATTSCRRRGADCARSGCNARAAPPSSLVEKLGSRARSRVEGAGLHAAHAHGPLAVRRGGLGRRDPRPLRSLARRPPVPVHHRLTPRSRRHQPGSVRRKAAGGEDAQRPRPQGDREREGEGAAGLPALGLAEGDERAAEAGAEGDAEDVGELDAAAGDALPCPARRGRGR